MSNLVAKPAISSEIIEKVVVQGDLSKLSSPERLSYYSHVCESVGLNPLTRPFEYIQLNGKLTLYARRDATDQLRSVHKVSVNITAREMMNEVFVVTARAKNSEGREDESTGAVFIGKLQGEALANAMMKAETKAKRRVTLSLCGLGILDETEIETIPEAVPVNEARPISKPSPIPEKAVNPGDFKIPFGKWKGDLIKDKDHAELANYVAYLEDGARTQNKPIQGVVAQFIANAEAFLSQESEPA